MSSDPLSSPSKQKLEGWKNIEAHLGVDKRTAQNWEKDLGLPVRRSPAGRVYALVEELDGWKLQNESLEALPPQSVHFPWLHVVSATLGIRIASATLVIAVITFLAFRLLSNSARVPAMFRLDGQALVVMDAAGKEMWRRNFPKGFWTEYYTARPSANGGSRFDINTPRVWFGDLDGDGKTEVLFLYHQAVQPLSNSTVLICYTERGIERWRWNPGRDLPELRNSAPTYITVGLAVLHAPRRRIVVSSWHEPYYPHQVALVNSQGKTLSEYWHSGHLDYLALADLDENRREEILLGGISHGYSQATVVVLDPDGVRGASKEAARPEVQLHGFGDAQERKRILFPRSSVNLALETYNQAVEITPTRRGMRVAVLECHLRPSCLVWYEFDKKLWLDSVTPDDQLRAAYKELFLDHRISQPLSPQEERTFSELRCLSGCEDGLRSTDISAIPHEIRQISRSSRGQSH